MPMNRMMPFRGSNPPWGRLRLGGLCLVVGFLVASHSPAWAGKKKRQEKILKQFEKETGLVKVELPGTGGEYLGKIHRGYRVLYTAKAGNVWGRFAARLVMGEIGREVGGILAYMTWSTEHGSGVAGSPLDRLLARLIGQPLSVMVTLEHGRRSAPRLEIYPGYAIIKPEMEMPKLEKIGSGAGFIHSRDREFARALMGNKKLVKRLKRLRGQYIGVDQRAVSLLWSGQEKEYSSMLRDHGGYWKMINAFLDDVADIADAIPEQH